MCICVCVCLCLCVCVCVYVCVCECECVYVELYICVRLGLFSCIWPNFHTETAVQDANFCAIRTLGPGNYIDLWPSKSEIPRSTIVGKGD